MLEEALAAILELVFGHIEGLSMVVTLLVAAYYVGYVKYLAIIARHLRLSAIVIVALILSGALDVSEIFSLASALAGLLGGLVF